MLNMCIELHLERESVPWKIIVTLIKSIVYGNCRHWLTSCNPLSTCPIEGQAGVPLEYFVRLHIGDANRGSEEKAEPSAFADSPVPFFLRTNDRAHC